MMNKSKKVLILIYSITSAIIVIGNMTSQVDAAPIELRVSECQEKTNSDGSTTRKCCTNKEKQDDGKLISSTKSQCSVTTCKKDGTTTTCTTSKSIFIHKRCKCSVTYIIN